MTTYPEHEKLKALGGANQIVGDFIEWLGEQGYTIAEYPKRANGQPGDELFWCGKSRDKLIAEHFEIDEAKLEEEKRAMLSEIRREPVE